MRPGLRDAILAGDIPNKRLHLERARPMAENTDWFEHLTTEEAKEERVMFAVWAARLGVLLTLLCAVAYAAMA